MLSLVAAIAVVTYLEIGNAYAHEVGAAPKQPCAFAAIITQTVRAMTTKILENLSPAALGIIETANTSLKTYDSDFSVTLDTTQAAKGLITATYDDESSVRGKILIEKGDVQYYYDITPACGTFGIPLQMGEGEYTVAIFKNIEGTRYQKKAELTLTVEGLCDEDVFTNSIQMVDYEKYHSALVEMSKLLSGASDDAQKVTLAYRYITSNLTYDSEKAEKVRPRYLPDLNEVTQTGKAVCYDFASLFAALLRSNHIPTKLVVGYRADVEGYHAWNEVLLNGKWVIIDTTADSSIVKSGGKTAMIKDPALFAKTGEY